ncbi:3D domain-containing protein [Christiangramia salexigens]|uniref:3D domain-containing protein n=1 Tax=Christiangramia salexigens TaxID=1913577 RepID=A0A1L3J378_9FLAO|nr:3D domain-containing protein [Christiangramia salexigens]APG59588.1 hypothetical protein LPB144_03820 [Christiangramia salexigens]
MKPISFSLYCLFLIVFSACKNDKLPGDEDWISLCVTATAYNSVLSQTQDNPRITAWGDTLKPGMNAIAVSRDLIKLGLDHNAKVKIEGFDSVFLVKDKMHYRWRNRIDIYMGNNVDNARDFGRKKLNIEYVFEKQPIK